MHELIHFEQARLALERAVSVDEVRAIRDKAEAARVYARQIGLSLEMQNQCAEIKLRAERRVGELLGSTPRQRPGEYQRSHDATVAASLANLGINKSQSARWQALARLPEGEFEGFIDSTKVRHRELTTAAALKLARQREARAPSNNGTEEGPEAVEGEASGGRRGMVAPSLEDLVAKGSRYGCILLDPPWRYGNQGTRASTDNHYETMGLEEIAALPVGELAAPASHLHLWTTNAFLFDSRALLEGWGFEYKSVLVWVKPDIGLGNYWRVAHEYLLLGVRGGAAFRDRSRRSWFEAPRGSHSEKPKEVREMLEAVSPGPHLELFARRRVAGWTVWGNQLS